MLTALSPLDSLGKIIGNAIHCLFICMFRKRLTQGVPEQVTHGPATHVMMCEGRKWRFLAFDESDLQFSLQCYIRIRPVGIMSITFDDGDVYEWTQVLDLQQKVSSLKRFHEESEMRMKLMMRQTIFHCNSLLRITLEGRL